MIRDYDDDPTIQIMPSRSEESDRRDYFIGKAKEAEALAVSNPDCKSKWMKIAEGYRSLAGSLPKSKA